METFVAEDEVGRDAEEDEDDEDAGDGVTGGSSSSLAFRRGKRNRPENQPIRHASR